jgi:Na+/melibiose symporter-like transporter
VLLSTSGLALAVFGILKSSTWGWIEPLAAPEVNGHEITPLGFSVVPFLILAGLVLLYVFGRWEERRRDRGADTLVDLALLKIKPLRAGLLTLCMQQLVLLGTFFVLPVYLQVVLGLDAFETGKRLFPMSVTMFIAALLGPRLAGRLAPKRVAQLGLLALVVAAVLLVDTIDVKLNGTAFALALALFGVGAGLLLSQLGNIIMSAVGGDQINIAGGLQGTAQNLGASLGTAFIGSVLIAALTTGFSDRVTANPDLPHAVQQQAAAAAQKGIPVAPVADVERAAQKAGATAAQASSIADDYGDAQLDGLRRALGAVALLAFLALPFTRHLPGRGPPDP